MKRDIVITAASGYSFHQVRYWVNSLDRCGFTGDRVVVVGNGDDALVGALRGRGCHVITRHELLSDVGRAQQTPFVDDDMSVARYFLFWKFLSGLSESDTRYVIAVDMRDAVFQLDPAMWLAQNIGAKRLVVASEGLSYEDQDWNRQSMTQAFGTHILDYMRERLVWNCGTIGGELAEFRDLALNLYLGCSARNVM